MRLFDLLRQSAVRLGDKPAAVFPGGESTSFAALDAEDVYKRQQQRLITAREVAALAVFLMSHDARGIHGQALNVCGGTSM